MALSKEAAVSVGLASAALAYSVYGNATPSITEIRAAKANDKDIEASRKLAAWTAAGAVAAISLLTRDGTVFVIGGVTVIVLDWWHRHANAVDPRVGKASVMSNKDGTLPVSTQSSDAEAYGYTGDMAESYA